MPRPLGVIQNSGALLDILQRFGVNRPTQSFILDGDVVPVVLVDSAISFVAAPTPPYKITDWFTAGVLVAPVANTVLADTGPLPVGQYSVQVFIWALEANRHEFQWRDAPNTATLRSQRLQSLVGGEIIQLSTRLNIQNANERFRILNIGNAGVGIEYQSSILAEI